MDSTQTEDEHLMPCTECPCHTKSESTRSPKLYIIPLAVVSFIQTLLLICLVFTSTHKKFDVQSERDARTDQYFSSNTEYMSLDPRYDSLWSETSTSGLINLPHANGSEQVGIVTMMHQLHCLAGLRHALQKAHRGEEVAYDWTEDQHWPHCLDYLRQHILCWADATIEWPDVVDGQQTTQISGMTTQRHCADSQRVFEFRDEHRFVQVAEE